MFANFRIRAVATTAAVLTAATIAVGAQSLKITRANLAKSAAFTVTTTTAPKGGAKVSSAMKVEVKGNKARVEMNNPHLGNVVYLANEQGVFFYIPANKVAQKQAFKDGVDAVLRQAFQQVNNRLKTATRTGTATVSGQTTDVYKDAKSGALLYIGRNPGFRLPVKSVITNEGGTQTFLVSNIKTNVTLPDARFRVPKGVEIIEANAAAGGPGMGGGFPR